MPSEAEEIRRQNLCSTAYINGPTSIDLRDMLFVGAAEVSSLRQCLRLDVSRVLCQAARVVRTMMKAPGIRSAAFDVRGRHDLTSRQRRRTPSWQRFGG